MAAQIAADVAKQLCENPPPIQSPWLDKYEAAEYLKLDGGARGLESMRAMGRGPKYSRPSHKIVRYHYKDLDAWLEANEERRTERAEREAAR